MQQCPFCDEILTQEQLQEIVSKAQDELMSCDEAYLAYDKQGKVRLYIYMYADDPFYTDYYDFECNYCPQCGRKLN